MASVWSRPKPLSGSREVGSGVEVSPAAPIRKPKMPPCRVSQLRRQHPGVVGGVDRLVPHRRRVTGKIDQPAQHRAVQPAREQHPELLVGGPFHAHEPVAPGRAVRADLASGVDRPPVEGPARRHDLAHAQLRRLQTRDGLGHRLAGPREHQIEVGAGRLLRGAPARLRERRAMRVAARDEDILGIELARDQQAARRSSATCPDTSAMRSRQTTAIRRSPSSTRKTRLRSGHCTPSPRGEPGMPTIGSPGSGVISTRPHPTRSMPVSSRALIRCKRDPIHPALSVA